MEPVKKYRIFLAGISATFICFGFGICIGWTSPILPKLRDHTADSPLDVGITPEQEGWISSVITIGAFASSLIAGSLAARIGRKWTLELSSALLSVSYIWLLVASKVWMMYVARVFQGIVCGLGSTAIAMYIGEIATDDCRGALGSLISLQIVAGILYAFIIGPYVSYMTLQWCCIAVPLLFIVVFFFMPESPYFFAQKGRKEDGIKSLQFLRGQSAATVEQEMTRIQAIIEADMLNRGTLAVVLRSRGHIKALFICCGLFAFQQLSGSSAVTVNSQSIFIIAKTDLDPAIASIIVGLVQFISNLITPFIVERIGRKIILLTSAVGMCVALFVLGAFFYIKAFGDASNILWLPVPALIFFQILYSVGFGPIPWAVLGEMFPSNIKPIAMSIATSFIWLMGFVVTRWFPELNVLGAYYSFWVFGSVCVLGFFFVIFVVIETKGMSLQKIQEKLHK